jgi:subtilisin family serine protease
VGGTRRYIVTTRPGLEREGLQLAARLVPAVNWPAATLPARRPTDQRPLPPLLLEEMGIVALQLEPETAERLRREVDGGSALLGIELEIPTFAKPAPQRGSLAGGPTDWGLRASGVDTSPWTGRGIAITVLDGSYDGSHPDLGIEKVTRKASFARGRPPDQWTSAHGTACLGLACARKVSGGLRYGVAIDATAHFGKVLDDHDRGSTVDLLAGIDWAIRESSHVISISVATDETQPSAAFEKAGSFALSRGCLIVGGAGNEPSRTVCQPANAMSILAVGGLNRQLRRSSASSMSGSAAGSRIDLAAPSEEITSAHPMDRAYATFSDGTSFAVPQVAGIAALWADATGARGRELWQSLIAAAKPLDEPSIFAGAGMVHAPQLTSLSGTLVVGGRPQLAPGTTTIVVTIDPALSDGSEVKKTLEDAGLKVTAILTHHAVMAGRIDSGLVPRVARIRGVKLVQVDDTHRHVTPL